MSVIDNVSYLIDSTSRASGTAQSGNYNFIPAGSIGPGTYELLSFNMANSFYNVETGVNDIIYWDEGAADIPATIPAGSYTGATLAVAMKVVMDAASASTFTIVLGADTGLYTFTIAAGTFRFKFLTNTVSPANRLIGFGAVDGVLAVAQTSTTPIDLSLHNNILIDIAQDATKNVTLLDGTETTYVVPITGAFGGEIDTLKRESFGQTMLLSANFNSLDIALLDESGVALVNTSEFKLIIRRLF